MCSLLVELPVVSLVLSLRGLLMEDQTRLKALVEESVKEANSPLSRELAEIRSMLLEVVGNKAAMGTPPP